MNTIDEMIEVLQAMKEGKAVECRDLEDDNNPWEKMMHTPPDFGCFEYRVKKEPMVIFGVVHKGGSVTVCESFMAAKELYNSRATHFGNERVTKFVEEI